MDKLDILKKKAEVANLERVASALDPTDSMYAALFSQAEKIKAEIKKTEKESTEA